MGDWAPAELQMDYEPSRWEVKHAPDQIEITLELLAMQGGGKQSRPIAVRGNSLYFGKNKPVRYVVVGLDAERGVLRCEKKEIGPDDNG